MHRQELIHPLDFIYYPVLAAFGIPVNLLAIVILSRGKCGLSKCITYYLVSMAVGDLLVIITDVILYKIVYYYFRGSFFDITPMCRLIVVLYASSQDCSVWLTVAFTFDRFIAICCQQIKRKYCTSETAAIVIIVVCVLFCLKCIPWFFAFGPRHVINNVQWDCILTQTFSNSEMWTVFAWLHRIFTPLLPFGLILLFNIMTVKNILVASRARKNLRNSHHGENYSDSEIANRRKSIILLFTISGSFILLWTTYVVYFLYVRITNAFYHTSLNDPLFKAQQAGSMLQLLSSCTNTSIYAVTQNKFRKEMRDAVKYLIAPIFKLIKYENS
ncbi:probable G-protein coupled receptor 139 [Stegostoma tigrinum]|uniref:probable G-protein coupled receptor 139 n=1 Tax=Stegostoma tigrinum TaxID=3053191 RepID=UPI002870067E|nr:probable G-protein coupled receptor 139 [Stegostoma tigrinum]